MRGIELNIPKYAKEFLHPADVVTWEAEYVDGRILREREGAKYRDIQRSLLKSFSLVQSGEVLFTTWPPPGADGFALAYRRTSDITPGVSRSVLFRVGWIPMGPAFVIDMGKATLREAPGFSWSDPDLYPPVPRPDEGERWRLDDLVMTR